MLPLTLDFLATRFDKETALEMYKAQFGPISSETYEREVLEEEYKED